MDELQKIKAEVKRLKASGCASPISVCNDLISFIESLQKEHASDDLDSIVISLEETIGTSPHSRDAIKDHLMKAADWQRRLDADLGSPAYERGFCNGREFERKNRKDLTEELELVKSWFDDIVDKSSRLTTGNVAHLGKNIRGFAGHYSEYVNDLIKEG